MSGVELAGAHVGFDEVRLPVDEVWLLDAVPLGDGLGALKGGDGGIGAAKAELEQPDR